jgi:50S ribosomal subunit-associated GTPase HflX
MKQIFLHAPKAIVYLVANKVDERGAYQPLITTGMNFAKERGYQFRMCSAFNGSGIQELFISITRHLLENSANEKLKKYDTDDVVIHLEDTSPTKEHTVSKSFCSC